MRREEYRLANGTFVARTLRHRHDVAVYCCDDDIRAAVARLDPATVISVDHFLGTALHETGGDFHAGTAGGCTNERDTEDNGVVTFGAYQLEEEEAAYAGLSKADLFDLNEATEVFARLTERRRLILRLAASLRSTDPDPSDLYGYLVVAHNMGVRTARTSILRYGMSWETFKDRNISHAKLLLASAPTPEDKVKAARELEKWRDIAAYGDDCLPGKWGTS